MTEQAHKRIEISVDTDALKAAVAKMKKQAKKAKKAKRKLRESRERAVEGLRNLMMPTTVYFTRGGGGGTGGAVSSAGAGGGGSCVPSPFGPMTAYPDGATVVAPAESKAALLRARGENFTGHQPRGEASDEVDEVEAPKRQVTPFEAALRERGKEIRAARAARQAEEAAELRGFYQGRNQAWRLLMENQKRHPDTIKVSRAFLGDFQRDLLHMQKED